MQKDKFYICVLEKDPKTEKPKIIAQRNSGYSDGDIGLHEVQYNSELNSWIATHIPTGLKLIDQRQEYHKTKASALKSAKDKINKSEFITKLNEYLDGEQHKKFSQSRYDQSVTGVY